MSVSGIGEAADLIKDLVDKYLPDKSQEQKDQFAAQMAQIAANTAEASQPGFHFRDGAGWMCVIAMGSNFIFRPLVMWVANLAGHPIDYPQLDQTVLAQMLFALLGLGSMHMYENVKGTK